MGQEELGFIGQRLINYSEEQNMTKMEELSKTVQEILGMSYKINIWAFYVNQDKPFSIRDPDNISIFKPLCEEFDKMGIEHRFIDAKNDIGEFIFYKKPPSEFFLEFKEDRNAYVELCYIMNMEDEISLIINWTKDLGFFRSISDKLSI